MNELNYLVSATSTLDIVTECPCPPSRVASAHYYRCILDLIHSAVNLDLLIYSYSVSHYLFKLLPTSGTTVYNR